MTKSKEYLDFAHPLLLAEKPIIGGDTAVTLTSADTLASLGVTVSSLGMASLDTSGSTPVAVFPITGGTEAHAGDVILHQGSGLELSAGSASVDLQDFRIDTKAGVVYSDVSADGSYVGDIAVFDVGKGDTLTLTATAASALDSVFSTDAFTSSTGIGTAAPSPIVDPIPLGFSPVLRFLSALPSSGSSGTEPIIGGKTSVTLTAASTLTSLGVSVTALGSATLNASGASPVAWFPITGGTEDSSGDVILHQGSGLKLSDALGSISLKDFLIDTQHDVVDANVTTGGTTLFGVAIFDVGAGGSLSLTSAAAGALNTSLHTTAFASGLVVGTADPAPIALPGEFAGLLHCG